MVSSLGFSKDMLVFLRYFETKLKIKKISEGGKDKCELRSAGKQAIPFRDFGKLTYRINE